jgi:hypothetical protein
VYNLPLETGTITTFELDQSRDVDRVIESFVTRSFEIEGVDTTSRGEGQKLKNTAINMDEAKKDFDTARLSNVNADRPTLIRSLILGATKQAHERFGDVITCGMILAMANDPSFGAQQPPSSTLVAIGDFRFVRVVVSEYKSKLAEEQRVEIQLAKEQLANEQRADEELVEQLRVEQQIQK